MCAGLGRGRRVANSVEKEAGEEAVAMSAAEEGKRLSHMANFSLRGKGGGTTT